MDNGRRRRSWTWPRRSGRPKGAGWDDNSRLPLGTAEVSPLAQASAYATFANDGVAVAEPRGPRGARRQGQGDLQGRAVEEQRAVSADIAADVTFALSSVVDGGTGRAAQTLNRPVAGKTGTKDREDDIVSAWFVGFTKQISTAVMYVAGDGGNDDLDPYARPGDSTFFGGTYPALTWADYMAVATEGQPVEDFGGPAYVNRDKYSEPTLRPEPTETQEPTEEPTETEEPEPTTSSPDPEPTETETEEPSPEPSAPATDDPALAATVEHPPDHAEPGAVEIPTATAKRPGDGLMAAPPGVPARRSTDPPSLTDGFVATVSQRFGGPIGRHAGDSGGRWWNPVRVALLTGTLVYLAGMVFRLPCRNGADHFKYLCYSDIPLLYPGRGLMQGNTPYLDSGDYPVLEYPVLTGWFLELERILTRLLGGAQGIDLTAEQQAESTLRFLDVNIVLLGGLFLIAVWAQVRTVAPGPGTG